MKINSLVFVYSKPKDIAFTNLTISATLKDVALVLTIAQFDSDKRGNYVVSIKRHETGNERIYTNTSLPKKYVSTVANLLELIGKIDFDAFKAFVVMNEKEKIVIEGEELERLVDSLTI